VLDVIQGAWYCTYKVTRNLRLGNSILWMRLCFKVECLNLVTYYTGAYK